MVSLAQWLVWHSGRCDTVVSLEQWLVWRFSLSALVRSYRIPIQNIEVQNIEVQKIGSESKFGT